MNDKNEKRITKRYSISEYIKEDYYNEIYFEINADKIYKPEIMDISINGLGFIINDNDDSINLDELDKMTYYFINIYFFNKCILTEAKKIWSIINEEKGIRTLRGGLAFSVMSSEDRLSLAEFIKTIRNKI